MEVIKNKFYRVKNQDTIKSICEKMKVSEKELIKINYITNQNIEVGDLLFLPESYNYVHIVKPLDNLNSIAKKYGVSLSHIENKNNLLSKDLFIGQKLVI